MASHQDSYDGQASMSVKGMHQATVDVQHLPGIVIFVHGVNSDGEWYEAAEQGLIRGLNRRMSLDRSAAGAGLSATSYAPELLGEGKVNRAIDGTNFIVDAGRSPIIRFRWGYKAAGKDGTEGSINEKDEYGSKIYLNELDAWGGGPFQNGTSALPYMWGEGVDDRVFWWLYANMFPVDGREVYASPPRAYFALAAHRLKELIKAIRDKQSDCPITVVCHSQGNMVTLAAALLGNREGALADSYVLCNPPYSLESLGMDKLVNDDSKSATGQFGSVSSADRKTTFKNFLNAVKARATMTRASQSLADINRYHEFKDPANGELAFRLQDYPASPASPPQPGIDRDNRGHVFLYCNPHDQVIGVSPVQGIGWKGVNEAQLGEIGAAGIFHQRVWAQPGGTQSPPFQVGSVAWTGRAYRYLADNHNPERFWNPPGPAMRYTLSLNERQGFVSRIVTVLTSVFVYLFTRVVTLRINDDPPKDWAVPIDAPVLPLPHTPRAQRYGTDTAFDQDKDAAADALAKADDTKKLRDGSGFDAAGAGDAESEAGLRYEVAARLRRLQAEAQKSGGTLSDEDQRDAVKRMLAENPNATDHSTILTHADNAERVLAYDVALGWVNPSRIGAKDMLAFRQFAHWMRLDECRTTMPSSVQFQDYWRRGFYGDQQIHRTYTMDHMKANAPDIADERRERNMLGKARL